MATTARAPGRREIGVRVDEHGGRDVPLPVRIDRRPVWRPAHVRDDQAAITQPFHQPRRIDERPGELHDRSLARTPDHRGRSCNPLRVVTAADPIRALPSALDERPRLRTRLTGRKLAVFLDYDGTLTPIVRRPDEAVLPSATRDALARAAERSPVAILSGRDLADVRAMVGVEGITYAGSHGFDIALPDGRSAQRGARSLPSLGAAEGELRPAVERIEGAWVERKRFAVAVHVREVDRALVPEVESAVAGVARD